MEAIIVAAVAAIPATIAATAAWRNARQAAFQTNGMLHTPLARMEETLNSLTRLLVDHVTDGERHAAVARRSAESDRSDALADRADQVAVLDQFRKARDAGERS
jgi:hypothetical protein